MKRKALLSMLALLLAISLVVVGCAKPAPAPEPAPTPAPAPTPTPAPTPAPTKVIELKMAWHTPPIGSLGTSCESWAKKVEEATNGRVKITTYPSQTLVKGADFYTSTVDGISDITFGVNVMDASRFPLNSVMDLPVMGWPNPTVASSIWKEVFSKYPEMSAEFKEVKVLFQCADIARQLHLTKKEARVPEDIRGMKIIATGPSGELLEALGASPVTILPPDYYMSLERGVAEGVCVDYAVISDAKVIPLLPYHTNLDLCYLGQELIMNLNTWNSLPPDIQKIIDSLEPWAVEGFLEQMDTMTVKAQKECQDLGHTIITPTPEELELWYAGKPLQDKWIADNEAKGLPAQAIYNDVQRLIKESSK